MRFTNSLNISEDDSAAVKAQRLRNRRLLAEGKATEKEKISIYAVKEEGAEPSELEGPVMDGWEILEFGPDGVSFSLNFTNPIYVSSGDEPDLLLV